MRILLEVKDAGNDKGAYSSKVAFDSYEVACAFLEERAEFRNAFSELEMKALDDFFNKVWRQIENGKWGVGTQVLTFIDGCTFSVAAISDSRH